MATINELQDEVVEEFQDFTDWMTSIRCSLTWATSWILSTRNTRTSRTLSTAARAAYGCNAIM